ncbi:hypothetical protein PVK06_005098 [Gossypium arboreum]|uniref:Uncharacterized protein n=1 Tax=Gossypium arboreum TaxID=29729 RepID=A0ABR0QTS3_GOSAR|nr:hypothetical protein PVK06_005098 [Gossypium arboreum]
MPEEWLFPHVDLAIASQQDLIGWDILDNTEVVTPINAPNVYLDCSHACNTTLNHTNLPLTLNHTNLPLTQLGCNIDHGMWKVVVMGVVHTKRCDELLILSDGHFSGVI